MCAPSCGEGRGACGPQQLVCQEKLKFDPDEKGRERKGRREKEGTLIK